jgi:hypothetical protein
VVRRVGHPGAVEGRLYGFPGVPPFGWVGWSGRGQRVGNLSSSTDEIEKNEIHTRSGTGSPRSPRQS